MIRGGDLQSFPYGPVMFLIFLPISFLGNIFGSLFNESFYFTGLGLRFTLLIIDFLCLKVLKKIVDNHNRDLVLYYWLSPLLIFITYWHGQLDIFPSFLMLIAFYFLKVGSYKVSGSLFAFSVAAKLSMVLEYRSKLNPQRKDELQRLVDEYKSANKDFNSTGEKNDKRRKTL